MLENEALLESALGWTFFFAQTGDSTACALGESSSLDHAW